LKNGLVSLRSRMATGLAKLAGRLDVAKATYTLDEWAARFAAAKDELADATDSGVDTSQPYASSLWTHAAISLISRQVARLPFQAKAGPNPDDPIVKQSQVEEFAKKPNSKQNWESFVEEAMINILLDGHEFLEPQDMTVGSISGVRNRSLRKLAANIAQDRDGDDVAMSWSRRKTGEKLIPGMDLFEWKLHNPYHDVYGLAPTTAARLAIYGDVATGTFNKAFFENGAMPSIVFHTDDERFGTKEAQEAADWWTTTHGGARRGHGVAFLGNGLRPSTLGVTHKDMDFGELAQLTKAQILAIYNIPETLLGAVKPKGGVQIGGGNRKPDEEQFFINTVTPWAMRFFTFFNVNISARIDTAVLVPNFKEVPVLQDRHHDRAKEAREWVKSGVPLNEVSEKFNLGFQSRPWGNEFWVPTNMVPARLQMNGPSVPNNEPPRKEKGESNDE